jgi:LCP family protein required for cell wall assembly
MLDFLAAERISEISVLGSSQRSYRAPRATLNPEPIDAGPPGLDLTYRVCAMNEQVAPSEGWRVVIEAAPDSAAPSARPQRALAEKPARVGSPRPARAVPPDRGAGRRHVPWLRLLGLLLVLVLVVVGYFVFVGVRALDRLERDPAILVDYPGRPAAGLGTNFLVIATHTADASTKADLIMLAHLNRSNSKVYLVPLPSDFYLTAEDGKQSELQELYAQGGASLQRVLEATLGTRIDHAAAVDFKGFIGLTEQLGGVVVDNPVDTTTPAGIHFAKGRITVAGKEALAYVADNSNFPGRAQVLQQRQQSVMRAIVLKTLQPETVLNPVMMSSVAKALAQHIKVDVSMTTPVIVQQAIATRIGSSSDIITAGAPVLGYTTSDDGGQATLPDPVLVSELSAALHNDTMDAYLAAHPA